LTAYRVFARKGPSTLRQDFPYLSEAFMFMRRMVEDGWMVDDPVTVSDGFLGFRADFVTATRLKTKENASV
jgi:hypothetical protein